MKLFKYYMILLIISLVTYPINSQNVFTYNDMPTMNASDSTPIIYKIASYADNRIVVHIIRPDLSYSTEGDKFWIEKYLSLRTIYPNGTVLPLDIKLDIQDFNFCIYAINGVYMSPIEIYPIRGRFVLVTYIKTTDLDDPFAYNELAMIFDLNGKSYGNISFGLAYVNITDNHWLSNRAEIFVNFNTDKGFLRLAPKTNTTDYIWQQYDV
ncbi:5590_t:CDS:2 [Funneliformis mosseae]|uniref:5590_t:CDS:1 n=1 Tax=Funneliformis mosseae TaxID=27381 RepID=A0A9N9B8D9_FUNMO|nr:5590_t:CDS:2 [Funneliformis mosseae]